MRLLTDVLAGLSGAYAAAEDQSEELTYSEEWFYSSIAVVLVLVAGLMSGLTLGLLSIDTVDLEVLKRSGTKTEQKYADAIEPLLKNQHYLLCTLVVWNAMAMEALPIFLDRLVNPVAAVIISVTVVLIFGEIMPQSVCTRYGLAVGYYTCWLMRFLMILAFPIAYPLGKLLDTLLGHSGGAIFRRSQLKAFTHVHAASAGFGGELTQAEVSFINGALDLHQKTAQAAMTPMNKVFMLAFDQRLDVECLTEIIATGHSRVPVYHRDKTDLVGVILVKELLLKLSDPPIRVRDLPLRQLPRLSVNMAMYDVLQLFKTGRAHMAVLCCASKDQKMSAEENYSTVGTHDAGQTSQGVEAPLLCPDIIPTAAALSPTRGVSNKDAYLDMAVGRPSGVITMEDIIEELIGTEIVDETDRFVDNLQTSKVNAALLTKSLPANIRSMMALGMFTKATPEIRSRVQTSVFDRGAPGTPQSGYSGQQPSEFLTNRSKSVIDAAKHIEEFLNSEPKVKDAVDVLRDAINVDPADLTNQSSKSC